MQIRRARTGENEILSRIAFEAKAHWRYRTEDLTRWGPDLTVTSQSVAELPTFVAELDDEAAGFFQIAFTQDGPELEHFWVRPARMGKGIGRAMLEEAIRVVAASGHDALRIDFDPNAEGFYRACGAVRTGEVAAPAEGQPRRVRPQLVLRAESI